ncbi:unnamed protein product [Miscanthus lutarioriparius]|uniref:Pre-rRNA-processing protein TSR2 n=1 Tax=Miscanthus lutarioriparius TaxID=422564 RepID=A0A811P8L8_9POAL|nr:unnamed protein product [Miscanthus lutarioriparius]
MAASNSAPISAEARAALGEAIRLVFARWTVLQVAVKNQWGGRDSCAKANQLGESILSWFCRSKGPHFFEDLVVMMEDKIVESFNADLDHNSVLDVADQLLFIHEQCLQSNYSPIEKLKNSHVQGNDVSQSREIVADDSDIPNDNDDTSVMNDEAAAAEETAVDSNPAPDADGWTVPRRRGRRAN